MIVCGFEDVREHKPAVSGKNPVHPVHRCESKIYPCLTMNRFPATRRRRLFQASRAPAPHDGADHSEGKQPFVNEDEPPMDTNRHEDRWTSFNDNWRQNAFALLSRWCDPVMGGSPPGSAGVPPAQILPQLRPSPPPESTGSGALPLLRPGPCGSRRQGGRLQHRRETERQPKGQHAGGTPALPGGVVPMVRWGVSGGRLL